jgi:aspartyl-tRNA(Asn)/glutamyl-tRNA(Gln) amidotransferase subunit B
MLTYEPVIGLEVHAQLRTHSKLFCGCATAFGAAPNTQTCPRCLGMPGTLPTLNAQAVTLALRAALGLNCRVHLHSQWSRKNYFYPDLPKGYQITQFDQPIATQGLLRIDADGIEMDAEITRIHIEEDAGKNMHDDWLAGQRSWVDCNRAGTPLIEIVGEPCLRSSAQAAAYLKTLRQVLRYLGVCDGNMDEGSLRCDANVSVRPVGTEKFGTRCELKNINSFRFVSQAIDYEIARQTQILQAGGQIEQQTRLWDTQAKVTRALRSKEEARDYRYFPEPDLPDLQLTQPQLETVRNSLPELPAARRARYVKDFGLSPYDARVLTDEADVAELFDQATAKQTNAKAVANWIINEVLRERRGNEGVSKLPFDGAALAQLIDLIDQGTLSGKMAKEVFAELMASGGTPQDIVARRGLVQVTDSATLQPIVDAVLAANPDSVAKYRAGRTNVLGFLVGQVMQRTRGQANPQLANTLLRAVLDAGAPA